MSAALLSPLAQSEALKQFPADQPETEQKAKHKHNKSKQSFDEETEEENASSVLMNLGTDGFGLQEGP